jgi:hypothetical protein
VIGRVAAAAIIAAALAALPRAVRSAAPRPAPSAPIPALDLFLKAAGRDDATAQAALAEIAAGWRNSYAGMVVDQLAMLQRTALGNPFEFVRYARLLRFLEQETGQSFGTSVARWRAWVWSQPYLPHPDYGAFKGALYAPIDPRFQDFFRDDPLESTIRLDQVDWGGVTVNGIPPLNHPKVLTAVAATYLEDSNIVFGVAWNEVARAYPKRILAWHEMALDRVGDVEITLVYCTLCGTVIPYESRFHDTTYTFGTSGLLYMSNKLMFDHETKSLWSSLEGVPVIGPLVGKHVRLAIRPVVTTTWGEWKREHPETTVLSLDTGYHRDYSEGAAYEAYFSTDALMFQVPRLDGRLHNKDEVLVLRPVPPSDAKPLAIAVRFLTSHRVYQTNLDGRALVIVTSAGGANRVYAAGAHTFTPGTDGEHVIDERGHAWKATEDLLRENDGSATLVRVPTHRAFWFGWYAQHPDTLVIRD